ncbi:hypothetical protein ENKNEFLB_02833 [Nocardioides aquaticus]|uniref:HK97 gp10 family phage protein n=1 Tax=Nocardioides aquaticus TaxID=160826 RepID=A0ABX8EMY8_9ACTN|nr:hypothetical protein [Nocardioides aquaticus]QVT80438.1 hypothetical protein ENKNEFLB_02833 [Nocardioides aquaticus]
MNRVGFRVQGLTQVVRALQDLGVDVEDLKGAFSAIAAKGAGLASDFAPKKSGRLASDIRGNRAKSKAVITAGRSSVPYAGPINYGWPKRGIEAAGFMQQADQALQPTVLSELENEINDRIRARGLNQ